MIILAIHPESPFNEGYIVSVFRDQHYLILIINAFNFPFVE